MDDPSSLSAIISLTTVLSLSAVALIVFIAYTLNRTLLPNNTPSKIRLMFAWHAFDAMVHFSLEGSYLYNVFFTWLPMPAFHEMDSLEDFAALPMTPHGVHFLSAPQRLYGAFYGEGVTAKLWQEYAKADRRWGGADLTVVSLELLTVGIMGPLAVYVCYCLVKKDWGKAWFWMTVIATGELYGGFMTFAPEWLTGSPNLDTSNIIYLWVYLFFMNMLWVVIPFWILYESYQSICKAPGPVIRRSKRKTG